MHCLACTASQQSASSYVEELARSVKLATLSAGALSCLELRVKNKSPKSKIASVQVMLMLCDSNDMQRNSSCLKCHRDSFLLHLFWSASLTGLLCAILSSHDGWIASGDSMSRSFPMDLCNVMLHDSMTEASVTAQPALSLGPACGCTPLTPLLSRSLLLCVSTITPCRDNARNLLGVCPSTPRLANCTCECAHQTSGDGAPHRLVSTTSVLEKCPTRVACNT
jgi:hypothetical protein